MKKMVEIKILLSFLIWLAATAKAQIRNQHTNIVFPDTDTNLNRTATHPRKPVDDPKRCDRATELLYPGDNEADWVCDCKPAYFFYPETQKCYPALTRGPCEHGEYLVLSKSSAIPKCEANPCRIDNHVLFQGKCSVLNKVESCRQYQQLIGRRVQLVVDPTTLELTCRDDDDNFKCANNCCIGSARYAYGKCDSIPQRNVVRKAAN